MPKYLAPHCNEIRENVRVKGEDEFNYLYLFDVSFYTYGDGRSNENVMITVLTK